MYPLVLRALELPHLAVAGCRLHDTNHSDRWLLFVLVPVIGFIVIARLCFRGDLSANRYVLDPQHMSATEKINYALTP